MKKLVNILTNNSFIFLGLLWVLVQVILYLYYGFVVDFEGLKYQDDAQQLLSSFSFNTERLFYSFYPIIISFFLKIKVGLKGVLFVQLLINAWATSRFYKLVESIFLNKYLANVLTAILILTFQIQIWNFHLYTESLFVSGIIIFSYYLLTQDLLITRNIIKLSLLLIILSFLRPTGILLLFPTITYLVFIYKSGVKIKYRIIPWIMAIILIIGANLIYSTGHFLNYTRTAYINSWVIWGYDGFGNMHSSIWILGFVKLVLYRILYYFSMLRPYYSNIHNLLAISFYPVYALSLIGIIPFWKKNRTSFLYVITTISFFSIFTILTFANWHGRFIVPILPFVILLSGAGMQYIFKNKFAN